MQPDVSLCERGTHHALRLTTAAIYLIIIPSRERGRTLARHASGVVASERRRWWRRHLGQPGAVARAIFRALGVL